MVAAQARVVNDNRPWRRQLLVSGPPRRFVLLHDRAAQSRPGDLDEIAGRRRHLPRAQISIMKAIVLKFST
jgi:hypothetical protein